MGSNGWRLPCGVTRQGHHDEDGLTHNMRKKLRQIIAGEEITHRDSHSHTIICGALARRGLLEQLPDGSWRPTEAGIALDGNKR